jgi:hypothetical protein
MAEDREEMKWIDAELNVFKEQYGALKERITREGEESSHADHVLEQSKAITLAVRHHVKTPTKNVRCVSEGMFVCLVWTLWPLVQLH